MTKALKFSLIVLLLAVLIAVFLVLLAKSQKPIILFEEDDDVLYLGEIGVGDDTVHLIWDEDGKILCMDDGTGNCNDEWETIENSVYKWDIS